MCNCNQKRIQYNNENSSSLSEKNQRGMIKVKLIQPEPIILNGDITGRTYVFRNLHDINWVDKRDAFHLAQLEGLQILN